jgi:hypothetical protein
MRLPRVVERHFHQLQACTQIKPFHNLHLEISILCIQFQSLGIQALGFSGKIDSIPDWIVETINREFDPSRKAYGTAIPKGSKRVGSMSAGAEWRVAVSHYPEKNMQRFESWKRTKTCREDRWIDVTEGRWMDRSVSSDGKRLLIEGVVSGGKWSDSCVADKSKSIDLMALRIIARSCKGMTSTAIAKE